jgi:hypothetical protein
MSSCIPYTFWSKSRKVRLNFQLLLRKIANCYRVAHIARDVQLPLRSRLAPPTAQISGEQQFYLSTKPLAKMSFRDDLSPKFSINQSIPFRRKCGQPLRQQKMSMDIQNLCGVRRIALEGYTRHCFSSRRNIAQDTTWCWGRMASNKWIHQRAQRRRVEVAHGLFTTLRPQP